MNTRSASHSCPACLLFSLVHYYVSLFYCCFVFWTILYFRWKLCEYVIVRTSVCESVLNLYVMDVFWWNWSQLLIIPFWRQLADATTSHQFFVACTGFWWSSGSTTSWPFLSKVAARSISIVPGRRLPADCGLQTPPASLHRSRQGRHCSENKHSTWRQEFLGRGSENLEQSTRLTAAAWHWIWTL